jgi:hypothetical protein
MLSRKTVTVHSHQPVPPFLWLLLLAVGGFVWWYFSPKEPVMPEEAKVLIAQPDINNKAIPHKQEKVTVFPASVDYLTPRTRAPKVRVEENIGKGEVAPPHRIHLKGVDDAPPPGFETKNWSGIVLVPEVARVSKAYTSAVHLSRVEAHPLKDGKLNVWVRMHNRTLQPVLVEKDCLFRVSGERIHNRLGFESIRIPEQGYVDVMFVSPLKTIEEYTILVRLSRKDPSATEETPSGEEAELNPP